MRRSSAAAVVAVFASALMTAAPAQAAEQGRIAFVRAPHGESDLFVMDPNGGHLRAHAGGLRERPRTVRGVHDPFERTPSPAADRLADRREPVARLVGRLPELNRPAYGR